MGLGSELLKVPRHGIAARGEREGIDTLLLPMPGWRKERARQGGGRRGRFVGRESPPQHRSCFVPSPLRLGWGRLHARAWLWPERRTVKEEMCAAG